MDKVMQWAISRILDITAGSFYGSVTLKFKDGKLISMDHQRTESPPAEAA